MAAKVFRIKMDNPCPICMEHPAAYFTECNHSYCIRCLSHIKKCALCRHPLQRVKLCVEIKKRNGINEQPPGPLYTYRISVDELPYFNSVIPSTDIHTSHPNGGINVYSFAVIPETHRPSGTLNISRLDGFITGEPSAYGTIMSRVDRFDREEHQPSGTMRSTRIFPNPWGM